MDEITEPLPPVRSGRFERFATERRRDPLAPAPLTEGSAPPQVHVREGLSRRSLAVADAFAAIVSLTLVVAWDAGAGFQSWILAAPPLIILVNKVGGLYERDELVLKKTTLDETPSLLQITGLFALIVWLGHWPLVHVYLGPPLILKLWVATLVAVSGGRWAARALVSRLSSPERCLVLGDAKSIRTVRAKIGSAGLNAEIVASVRLDPAAPAIDTEPFRRLVVEHQVHRVIVAPVTTDAADTLELIRVAKAVGVRVSVLPRLFEVVGSAVEFDQIDGLTMLGVRRFGLSRSSLALKRAFDVVGATVALIAVAPIMAATALAVRLDSPGPVSFRQTRVGRDGRSFEIFKFRTMVMEAEALKRGLAHLNESDGFFKMTRDPRITRVGSFLRRTSLDEMPQLFNVWRGEMSLVGPRPLVVDEDAKIEGLDRDRLHLTPGMTGHWQILGSSRIPLHEMVEIDYLYVANWSLWTDLKILLRTVPYMLARRGM
ncbi:MAG: hypothetical protein QOK21_3664 [Solirubrobacteraceae bacterium]|nr:hypothetical protein [Solirubrobacteraceae bacterium]